MRNKETDSSPNREEDIFYDYFKNNIENHQLPVDERCWENISERISPKRRNIPEMFFYSGIAAAVLLILVYVLKTNEPQYGSFALYKTDMNIKNRVEYKSVAYFVGLCNQQNRQPLIDDSKGNKIVSNKLDKDTMSLPEKKVKVKEEAPHFTAAKEDRVVEKTKTTPDSIPKKKIIDNLDMYPKNNHLILAYEASQRKHNKWELGASLNTSVIESNSSTASSLVMAEPECGNNSKYTSNAISDVSYAPPFSVGVLVSKKMNNILRLETGLTYSYLTTTYKDIDRQYYSAELKLHYIGIPVNLIANIYNITPQWKLYAGTGVMVEKGIRSDLSQYMYETEKTVTRVEDIKGLQWSISASVGLSYKLYKNWNLYLEPHASYYFDNNQPLSIRTEKQTILGINAGFKYEF